MRGGKEGGGIEEERGLGEEEDRWERRIEEEGR